MGKANIKKAADIEAERLEREEQKRKRDIDKELEAIDKATIRPERAIRAAESKEKDPAQADIDRLITLEEAAAKLRNQRDGSGEIDWPEWRN